MNVRISLANTFLVCLPLREHLQTAMEIELATIPLYLFGMYSIKIPAQYANDQSHYDPVIGVIRGPLSFLFVLKLLPSIYFYRCCWWGYTAPQSGWKYSSRDLVATQSFMMASLYRVTPCWYPDLFSSSGLSSEEQARKIIRRLLMYVFLFTGRRFLLCTFYDTLDWLRHEQCLVRNLNQTNTKPLPSSTQIFLRYDLACFQSSIDTPGQEIPWFIPSEYSQLSICSRSWISMTGQTRMVQSS